MKIDKSNILYWLFVSLFLCTFAYGSSKATDAIAKASKSVGVPHVLLFAVCKVESNLNPAALGDHDQAEPSVGLCQIKRSTAKIYGFKGTTTDLLNPYTNAKYAAFHLHKLLVKHAQNWNYAVAEYNFGTLKFNYKGLIWNRGYVYKVRSTLKKLNYKGEDNE